MSHAAPQRVGSMMDVTLCTVYMTPPCLTLEAKQTPTKCATCDVNPADIRDDVNGRCRASRAGQAAQEVHQARQDEKAPPGVKLIVRVGRLV